VKKYLISAAIFFVLATSFAFAQFAMFQVAGPNPSSGYGGGPYLRAQNYFSCSPAALTPADYYKPGSGCPAVSTADYYHINGIYGMRPLDLTSSACGAAGAAIAASKGRYAWPVTPDHGSGINGRDWTDGQDLMIGFSNDPGIPPSILTPVIRWPQQNLVANAPGATFTGTIASSLLNVSSMSSGGLSLGQPLTYSGGTGTLSGSNAPNTGRGQTGTYALSASSGDVGTPTAMTTTQSNVYMMFFPYLVCNPDDMTNPFYFYAQTFGSQFEFATGVATSPDLVNFTVYGTTHKLYSGFTDQATGMQIYRSGVNTWQSIGRTANDNVHVIGAAGTWTSSDGKNFLWGGALANTCLPANSPPGDINCANGSTLFGLGTSLPEGWITTVGGQAYLTYSAAYNVLSNSNLDGQRVVLAPVDGSYNVLTSPAVINISDLYCPSGGSSCFPGPQFLQGQGQYNEDGIAHFYPITGFFACIVGGCASNTSIQFVPGITVGANYGLYQQFMSHYCYVFDASAAINAAPTGVAVSAAAGVVTLTWDDCYAGRSYRIYSGTTAGSQTTLVTSSVAGTTYSYSPGSTGLLYYKVVTLNGGTEEQSRVVGTYVSSSAAIVNAHETRALAAGATNIDRTWLDSVQSLMVAQGLTNNLRTWADPSFGVVKDGSNNTSIVFDLGTTRLPRGGDLTFCTGGNPCNGASTAVYGATSFNGDAPGVVNPSTAGYSYFGGTAGGRINNLRRMFQFSVCAAYSKPGTALATLIGFGGTDFPNPTMQLQHTAGSPGNASFSLRDDVQIKTVTQAMSSATGTHVICGTFDTTGATTPTSTGTLKVYADGTATGSPDTSLHSNIDGSLSTTTLGATGQQGLAAFVGSGSTNTKASLGAPAPTFATWSHIYEQDEGNFTVGAIMIFDVALTQAQVTAITNAYLNK
jgi:hypothetical protein